MKKIIYAFVMIAVMGTYGCASDIAENNSTGSIVGSVSDRTTGEPVATVNVTLSPGGKSTVTGSDGSFSFIDLDAGEYTINIRKESYTPTSGHVSVKAGQTTQSHLLIDRIPATITADRELLDFGESIGTMSFTIVNSGYTDLAYKVETGNCPWISVDPINDILAYGKTASIIVTIDRTLLESGVNEAILVVRSTSGNGNVEITVRATGEYRSTAALNTLDATDITKTTATLNAEITDPGAPLYTERGFVYSTEADPTIESNMERLSCPITSNNRFSCTVERLSPTQAYYVRAYLIQNEEVIYGNTIVFTTSEQSVIIATSAVTGIGSTYATLNASIADAGTPAYTERGFCISSSKREPTVADNRMPESGTGIGTFTLQVSGLTYQTRYYVRAYAIQNGQPTYGNVVEFTTIFVSASVTTYAATEIDTTTAKLNGTIQNVGEPRYTERGFCYSDTKYTPTISDSKLSEVNFVAGNYSKTITGLAEGTTYYYRAYVMQDGKPIYGSVLSFTTNQSPIVVTGNVIDISPIDLGGGFFFQWKATLQGGIAYVGNPAYSQRGFVYATHSDPRVGSDTSVAVIGTGGGVYATTVSGLTNAQTYYVKAYVKVGTKYIYGETVSFQTFQ